MRPDVRDLNEFCLLKSCLLDRQPLLLSQESQGSERDLHCPGMATDANTIHAFLSCPQLGSIWPVNYRHSPLSPFFHSHMQAPFRFRSNAASKPRYKVLVSELCLKRANPRRKHACKLRFRESLADATSWSMQKREIGVVATRATRVDSARSKPAVWIEGCAVGAPQRGAGVDCPRRNDDCGSFGDDVAGYCCVSDG